MRNTVRAALKRLGTLAGRAQGPEQGVHRWTMLHSPATGAGREVKAGPPTGPRALAAVTAVHLEVKGIQIPTAPTATTFRNSKAWQIAG